MPAFALNFAAYPAGKPADWTERGTNLNRLQVGTFTGATGNKALNYIANTSSNNAALSAPLFDHLSITVQVRVYYELSYTGIRGVCLLRGSGTWGSNFTGYALRTDNGSTFLYRYTNGVGTQIITAPGPAFTVGGWHTFDVEITEVTSPVAQTQIRIRRDTQTYSSVHANSGTRPGGGWFALGGQMPQNVSSPNIYVRYDYANGTYTESATPLLFNVTLTGVGGLSTGVQAPDARTLLGSLLSTAGSLSSGLDVSESALILMGAILHALGETSIGFTYPIPSIWSYCGPGETVSVEDCAESAGEYEACTTSTLATIDAPEEPEDTFTACEPGESVPWSDCEN